MFSFRNNTAGKFETKIRHSSYWLRDWYGFSSRQEVDSFDPLKYSKILRSVSNFVQIVTGKDYPVRYSTGNDSFCSPQTGITISADIENLDVVVGLALHEASHLLLTEFWDADKPLDVKPEDTTFYQDKIPQELKKYVKQKYPNLIDENKLAIFFVKTLNVLRNWIEDRRIDAWQFKHAPGYQGYYQEVYKKYFHSPKIDEMLKSSNMREEKWDCYIARIINLLNKNSDLDALKGLRQINQVLDLKNIDRLKSNNDSMRLAIEVFRIVEDHVKSQNPKDDQEKNQDDQEGQNQGSNDEGQNQGSNEGQNQGSNDEDQNQGSNDSRRKKKKKSNDGQDDINEDEFDEDGNPLTPSDSIDDLLNGTSNPEEATKKSLAKQIDLINGKTNKKTLTKNQSERVEQINQTHTDVVETFDNKIETLIIHDFNQKLIDSDPFLIFGRQNRYFNECMTEGTELGKKLVKKLKIQKEEKSTFFNRKPKGKLDKRMIYSAGFDNQNLFKQLEQEVATDTFIYLSIDASGSMDGVKFNNAQKTAIALAYCSSVIEGFDLAISYRLTYHLGQSNRPLVLNAYDSRVDNFSKIKLFRYIKACSMTPEAVCFEAMSKDMLETNSNRNILFINISDGMPSFTYFNEKTQEVTDYSGTQSTRHTKREVARLKKKGIEILSFYVSENDSEYTVRGFKEMYGDTAEFINVTQLSELAFALNKKFLKRRKI